MNRQRRRRRARQRHFRVEAVPRQSPDLHKLAQVFLAMAVARAEQDARPGDRDQPEPRTKPAPEAAPKVE